MADSKFKRALNYAFQQEMDEIPPQYELERKFIFSAVFEEKMKKLINDVNKRYISAFGLTLPKYTIAVLLMIATGLAIVIRRSKNILDRPTARLIFSLVELFILAVFGINVKRVGNSMTRTVQTGFTDLEDETANEEELEFIIPTAPLNYSKSGEYRTTTLHTIEYKDAMGRVISYERILVKGGLLTKIDTPEKVNSCKVHQWEAIWFIKDQQTNLVWADKTYRYHLKGMCNTDILIKMGESLYN